MKYATRIEVLKAMVAAEITQDEADAALLELAQQNAPAPRKGPKRLIKQNAGGGLYVTDPSFKAWSDKKSKWYTAGVNINVAWDVIRALFSDDDLLLEIRAYVELVDKQAPKPNASKVVEGIERAQSAAV